MKCTQLALVLFTLIPSGYVLGQDSLITKFEFHTDRVNSLAISKDGKMIASGSKDKTVVIADIASNSLIAKFTDHNENVLSVLFSKNDKYLFSVSSRKIIVIELATMVSRQINLFDDISIVKPGNEEDVLWVVGTNNDLKDLSAKTELSKLWKFNITNDKYKEYALTPGELAVSSDGKKFYAPSGSRLEAYDAETGKVLKSYEGSEGNFKSISLNPDNNYLVAVYGNLNTSIKPTARAYSPYTGKFIPYLRVFGYPTKVIAYDDYFVVADRGNLKFKKYLSRGDETISTGASKIIDFALSPDERYLVVSVEGTSGVAFWKNPFANTNDRLAIDTLEVYKKEVYKKKMDVLNAKNLDSYNFIEFGAVSEEEMNMISYEKDTTAAAIILFDKGRFNSNTGEFSRDLRIKILKSAGTKWGNWTLDIPTKSSIKGIVYNIVNGQLVSEKITKDNIFEEEAVDRYFIYKVFAPNVKVGSVIDISFKHGGVPFEWRFQQEIPVVYSELTLDPANYMNYNKSFFGLEPIKTISDKKWVGENMPAFKIEPFISDYKNYITKFRFQLTSYRGYDFSSSWEKIINTLSGHSRFGSIMDGADFLDSYAKNVASLDTPLIAKINLAQNHIRQNLKYNGIDYILGSYDYRRNFTKNHSANSVEINLLLIALLRKIGINTKAVVLSTRSNGLIIRHRASIDQLNYVLAYVEQDGFSTVVDATSEEMIPGIVPEKCLNGEGLIIEKDKVSWIPLHQGQSNQKVQLVNIALDKDGNATATVSQRLKDYAYLEWKKFRNENPDERKYLQDVSNRYPKINFEEYEVINENASTLTCNEKFTVDLSKSVMDLGNEILISPVLMPYYSENPFKTEERKYPVDLAYSIDYSATIILTIPEDHKIKKLPEPVRLVTEGGDVSFMLISNANGNQAQMQVMMKIGRTIFTEVEYQELRRFFSLIIEKMSESIEITKNT